MTSDLGVIAFFFFFFRKRSPITPVSECTSLGEAVWGSCYLTKLRHLVTHTLGWAYRVFSEICFSCSPFFPLSNAGNWEGHRTDYIGYMQAAFRLPSRALSVQFRPDHNSPELYLSFMLSFLSMKKILTGAWVKVAGESLCFTRQSGS